MEVEANDDYDFIPGTPPHKKVILVYMLFLVNLALLQTTKEPWTEITVACTQKLFYFSFRYFRIPRGFCFYHAHSTDFEKKIEGLWTG